MRFHKQQHLLTVKDLIPESTDNHSYHGPLFSDSLRTIICGPSGCGKTNVMLNLIFHENGLRFENIYVYSKSLYQPKYQLLENILKLVDGVQYFPFSDTSEILEPSDAREQSLFIFDDVSCHSQQRIREYFSMGRHRKIDCFYLCQSYACVPKHNIRDNLNCLILFKTDEMNLKHIFDNHVGSDMNFRKFHDLCNQCWSSSPNGFVVIMKNFPLSVG